MRTLAKQPQLSSWSARGDAAWASYRGKTWMVSSRVPGSAAQAPRGLSGQWLRIRQLKIAWIDMQEASD